jgi:hypothetical protein
VSRGDTLGQAATTTTEFVCERWGQGEAYVDLYAPLTRGDDGTIWIHPTGAKDYQWEVIVSRATRIWRVSGSFWNPGTLTLIYCREKGATATVPGERDAEERRMAA